MPLLLMMASKLISELQCDNPCFSDHRILFDGLIDKFQPRYG